MEPDKSQPKEGTHKAESEDGEGEVEEEEEIFAAGDEPLTTFDKGMGALEEIVMEDGFQSTQDAFMLRHRHLFEASDENKLCYTEVYNEYVQLMDRLITKQLTSRSIDVPAFLQEVTVKSKEEDLDGDLWDLLFSLTDFRAFKELMLSYQLPKSANAGLPHADHCKGNADLSVQGASQPSPKKEKPNKT
ncbi:hypothetical protein DIPPA_29163 [Diplonema papillatum]|nr:hypothetical protein DIPPA_29163 [Diplonema papillatum]